MQLNYKTYGQGDPIIILHGLFGTLDNWQTVGKQLAENYMVYLVDQRNHGRSPHLDEITYPLMANDLRSFMENQWVHQAHVIGHSMGGKTAMQFALSYPDMVDKLIVVDIATEAYPGGHEQIFEALLSLDLTEVDSRSDAAAHLEQAGIQEAGIRQFLLKNLSRKKEGGYEWKMNLPAIHEHYQDILAAVESSEVYNDPTLFIRGGQSQYVNDDNWPAVLQLFPNAKLETVENAGHWVHAEAPEALLQHVTRFLES